MVIQVQVHGPSTEVKIIDLCETEEQLKRITVKQFRETAVKRFSTDDDVDFVFGDKRLEDDKFLVTYGIINMSVIFMVLQMPGGIR